MTNMFDLSGRVALVSGAASGMGKRSSLALAEAGADVVLADLNEEGAQATAAEIESLGRGALPVRCDISKPADIRAMFVISFHIFVICSYTFRGKASSS